MESAGDGADNSAIMEIKPLVSMTEPVAYREKPERCLYCPNPLPSMSGEHLFNAAWGGHHKTRWIVCDECNGAFGEGVDKALLPIVRYVMNARNAKGERQSEPPSIETDGGVILRPYGRPESPVRMEAKVDGDRLVISGSAPTRRTALRAAMAAAEEAKGGPLSDAVREEIRRQVIESPSTAASAGEIEQLFSLDILGAYRSAAHTALKALSAFEPTLARDPLFEAARRFARHGEGAWEDCAVTLRTSIDAADVLDTPGGVLKNSVQLWFDPSGGYVVARLTVLDRIVRDVRLASGYDGPNRTLYVLEPWGHRNRLPAIGARFGTPPGHREHGLAVRMVEVGPAPTFDDMARDLASVLSRSLGPDALRAALGDGLVKAVERHTTFSAEARREMSEVAVDTLARLSHLAGDPRPEAEARTFVAEAGFEGRLASFADQLTEGGAVLDAVADAFESVMSGWVAQLDVEDPS